jgi:excisionase family DNA binding protein
MTAQTTKQPDFYLVSELAEKLRVSEMTIYRYIEAGKLKAHRLGKGYRIPTDEYERFLKSIRT